MAQDVGEQAPTLPDEALHPEYTEPLWRRIGEEPEVRGRLNRQGFDIAYKPAAAFAAMATEDHARYGELIRGLGIGPQ